MSWRNDLHPVKNWRGWAVALMCIALFALVGSLEFEDAQRLDALHNELRNALQQGAAR